MPTPPAQASSSSFWGHAWALSSPDLGAPAWLCGPASLPRAQVGTEPWPQPDLPGSLHLDQRPPCSFAAFVVSVGRASPRFPHAHGHSRDQNQLQGLKIASPACPRCQAPGWGRNPAPRKGHHLQGRRAAAASQDTPGSGPGACARAGPSLSAGSRSPREAWMERATRWGPESPPEGAFLLPRPIPLSSPQLSPLWPSL